MGLETGFLGKILPVKTRNLPRNRVSEVSARRELCVLGVQGSLVFFNLWNYFCIDRPVETVEKKANCLLRVTYR